MSKEAMKLALGALESKDTWGSSIRDAKERAITALREALAEQPARPYRLLQDNGSKYFGASWDKAEQPAQQEPVALAHKHINATLAAFGPGEAISMTKETWAKLREAIKTLAEQPAQQALDKMAENARELGLDYEPAQQEPVAWMNPNGGMLTAKYIDNFASGLDKEIHSIPLYTSPTTQKECEKCSHKND